MTVGEKIRSYRELRGMTQLQLAQASGIPFGTIRKYEINNRNPKPEQQKKIAEALNISPHALIDAEFETIGDIAPYLIKLSKVAGIRFDGTLDEEGKYCIEDIKISFDSAILRMFLKKWADQKAVIDKLRWEAKFSPDEQVKEYALKRADELEAEMELRMVDSQLLINRKQS